MGLAQGSVLEAGELCPAYLDTAKLVRSIAAGDATASDRFRAATSGLLFGLLLRILGDTATADRVLLTVYEEVKLNAAGFGKNADSLLTWLVTIAHRRALEQLCSSKEDQQFLISVGLAMAPGLGTRRQTAIRKSAHRKLVVATLNSLSALERKMIELAYFSRMAPDAIALQLGKPPEEVRTGLQCGILGLYNLFRNYGSLSDA